MVFPYSILVREFSAAAISYRHGAGLIEAESDDEAFGKVTKLALKVYPKPYFIHHHVTIGTTEIITDVDDVTIKTSPAKHG